MPVTEEQKHIIVKIYSDRFGCTVTSVNDGVEGIFGGSLAIASYMPPQLETAADVVYIGNNGTPMVFETTQELLMFLRQKMKFQFFHAFIDSKMFQAIVFICLLIAVFWAGWVNQGFSANALAMLGSVVGLAAGLFFGTAKK
jgi:hypothetical protein